MTNLTLKYLLWRSHNAIVGETPYVQAIEPKTLCAACGEVGEAHEHQSAEAIAVAQEALEAELDSPQS